MPSRSALRVLFAAALLLSAAVLAYGAATTPTTSSASTVPDAPPRDGVTVVTESARHGAIIAWNPDGSLLYYEDEHTKYYDVDPVPNESMTVEYAATNTIHAEGPTCSSPPCTRNVIERVNLSTGEVTEVYARYDNHEYAGEWHDHERVDDQVLLVDTETELVEWMWDAQSDFPVEGGGPYPDDWAHLNDVDLLDDGRVMVSLRNQDQVVFIDRETGLVEDWTLGSEDDYDTLYEQHNPDYIPEERGGPAVLVADSENGRIVEYQREDGEAQSAADNRTQSGDGEWVQSWEWADERMQWPRDADRLPNGNTLVADTHGSRIMEIDPEGEIVWSVFVDHPYDVERLSTGSGSDGGESAERLGLESRTAADDGDGGVSPLAMLSGLAQWLLPSWIYNGILYVAPVWMGRPQFLAAGVGLLVALAWPIVELQWRFPHVGLRSPIYRRSE